MILPSGKKDVVMERAHARGNFYLGFDASHLLQLSTNRFLRVNGNICNHDSGIKRGPTADWVKNKAQNTDFLPSDPGA